MRFVLPSALALTLTVSMVGCKSEKKHARDPIVTTGTIGPEGGTITAPGGTALAFDAASVDTNLEITIVQTFEDAPDEAGATSSLYRFEPDGLVFAHPVRLTLALPSDSDIGTVYWSKLTGEGYDNLGGEVVNGSVTVDVVHFSSGFVASPTGTRTVIGSNVVTWASQSRINNVPQDLSGAVINALVADSAGGFQTLAGIGEANGTFRIPDVPVGTYYLQLGDDYYVTSDSSIDLGSTVLGRPDAIDLTTEVTDVFDVAGLGTWQDGDSLELLCTGNDTFFFGLEQTWPVAVASTSLSGYAVSMSQQNSTAHPARLVEGSKGDRLTLAQLSVTTTLGGVPYQRMSRVFEPEPFDQADGDTTLLSGAFTDVSSAISVDADVRSTQFFAMRPDVNPAATDIFGVFFGVLGIPGGLEYGEYTGSADFVLLNATTGQDLAATGMEYGEPLQGTWGTIGEVLEDFRVSFALGSSTPVSHRIRNAFNGNLATDFGGALVPRMSPPLNVTVGGTDAFSAPTGVGITPVIAWNAPAIGTPSQYDLELFHLTESVGATVKSRVAGFSTQGTSIALPPDVLTSGESYFFTLRATSSTVPLTSPERSGFPSAKASMISSIFVP